MVRNQIFQSYSCVIIMIIIIFSLHVSFSTISDNSTHDYNDNSEYDAEVIRKIKLWAPLVWLAPDEEFFPSSASSFLEHAHPWTPDHPEVASATSDTFPLPTGPISQSWFLVTKYPIDDLLQNKSSMIYGERPINNRVSVGAYAQVTRCAKKLHFHVTYWLFFPYNKGKEVCTMGLGPFGLWPMPLVNGHCLGKMKEFGSHVGDWEHMSLLFKGGEKPTQMYISAHDSGAFYKFEPNSKRFLFQKQQVAMLQRPHFPKFVKLFSGSNHPMLFAAKGSHGLWAAPGKHKYLRLPRLYDEGGYGSAWATWQSLQILRGNDSTWLDFWGRWGNPKSQCHPFARSICQQSDGPTGIPMKKKHFVCDIPPHSKGL